MLWLVLNNCRSKFLWRVASVCAAPVGALASAGLCLCVFLEIILSIELYTPERFGFLTVFYLSALSHPFGAKPAVLPSRAAIYVRSTCINFNNLKKWIAFIPNLCVHYKSQTFSAFPSCRSLQNLQTVGVVMLCFSHIPPIFPSYNARCATVPWYWIYKF